MSASVEASHSSQEEHRHAAALTAIATLLSGAGIDPTHLAQALEAIGTAQQTADEVRGDDDLKFFSDKTLVYEDHEAFIYQRGDSKSGKYYIRIYDEKSKKAITRSLKTSDKAKALATARVLFIEIKGKIDRGERVSTLTTSQLVQMYTKSLKENVSDMPRAGITPEHLRLKVYFLDNWEAYITSLGLSNVPIDRIDPEQTVGFGKYLERKPKKDGKPRSRELINNNISEVMRMYKNIAVRFKYISADHLPKIERLTEQPDEAYKRDILTEEQYEKYWHYLHFKYTRDGKQSEEELLKRKIFQHFIGILYSTGMRPKELLGLKRKEVRLNKRYKEDPGNQSVIIWVRKENSKTGRSRTVVGDIRDKFNAVISAYESLGVIHSPDDYVFLNSLSKDKRAFTRQNYYQRLKDSLAKSGLQKELDEEGKSITLYSARHSYATWQLRHGDVPIELLAKQMGTSIAKIESTYGHIEVEKQADRFTKAQNVLRRQSVSFQSDLDLLFKEEE